MLAVSYLCTSGSLSTRQVLSACHWMEYVPQWFSMNYLNWSTSIAHGGNQKRYAAHKQGFALTLSLTHNACFGAPSRWWYLAQPNQNAARWLQAMSTSDIMANQNDNALTMLDNGKNPVWNCLDIDMSLVSFHNIFCATLEGNASRGWKST